MKAMELNAGDAMHGLTLTVEVKRTAAFDLRMWLGLQLFRLGALVMGFARFKVEETPSAGDLP
jgi:hypothetical protein